MDGAARTELKSAFLQRFLLMTVVVVALPGAYQYFGGAAVVGARAQAQAHQVVETFVTRFHPLDADLEIQEAFTGWQGLGGAKPGAALGSVGVAMGGRVTLDGHPAEVALAAPRAAIGARDPGHAVNAMMGQGVAGTIRVHPEGVSAPGSARAAEALFDSILGAPARHGQSFEELRSGQYGFAGWIQRSAGRGTDHRAAWVSTSSGEV